MLYIFPKRTQYTRVHINWMIFKRNGLIKNYYFREDKKTL